MVNHKVKGILNYRVEATGSVEISSIIADQNYIYAAGIYSKLVTVYKRDSLAIFKQIDFSAKTQTTIRLLQDDNYLYIISYYGQRIVKYSKSDFSKVSENLGIVTNNVRDAFLENGYIYLGGNDSALYKYACSDLSLVANQTQGTTAESIRLLFYNNNKIYVLLSNSIKIYDMSFNFIGTITASAPIYHASIDDNYIYVNYPDLYYIEVFSLTSPYASVKTITLPFTNNTNMKIFNGYLYVAKDTVMLCMNLTTEKIEDYLTLSHDADSSMSNFFIDDELVIPPASLSSTENYMLKIPAYEKTNSFLPEKNIIFEADNESFGLYGSFTTDEDYLYAITYNSTLINRKIKKFNLSTGVFVSEVVSNYNYELSDIVVDDTYFYVTEKANKTVARYNKSTMTFVNRTSVLAAGELLFIAMSDNYIYATGNNMSIYHYSKDLSARSQFSNSLLTITRGLKVLDGNVINFGEASNRMAFKAFNISTLALAKNYSNEFQSYSDYSRFLDVAFDNNRLFFTVGSSSASYLNSRYGTLVFDSSTFIIIDNIINASSSLIGPNGDYTKIIIDDKYIYMLGGSQYGPKLDVFDKSTYHFLGSSQTIFYNSSGVNNVKLINGTFYAQGNDKTTVNTTKIFTYNKSTFGSFINTLLGTLRINKVMLGNTEIKTAYKGKLPLISSGEDVDNNYAIVSTFNSGEHDTLIFDLIDGSFNVFSSSGSFGDGISLNGSRQLFFDASGNIVMGVDHNGGLSSFKLFDKKRNRAMGFAPGTISPAGRTGLGVNSTFKRNYIEKNNNVVYSNLYNGIIKKTTLTSITQSNYIQTAQYDPGSYPSGIILSSTGYLFVNFPNLKKLMKFDKDDLSLISTSGASSRYGAATLTLDNDGYIISMMDRTIYKDDHAFSNNNSPLISSVSVSAYFNGGTILVDSQGNYLYTSSNPTGIVKVSSTGDLIWSHTVTSTEGTVRVFNFVLDENDNIYGIWGDAYGGHSTGVFAISSSGTELWKKELTTDVLGSSHYCGSIILKNNYKPTQFG